VQGTANAQSPPADPAAPAAPAAPAPASTETRLTSLEGKMDELTGLVRGMATSAHSAAASHEQAKLDRPTQATETAAGRAETLRSEIAAELGKLRQQERTDKDAADTAARLKKVEAAVEKAPRQFRRVEEAMGWIRKGDS
jgi:hypothetical protein